MVQVQSVYQKMKFSLGYNMKIVLFRREELTIGQREDKNLTYVVGEFFQEGSMNKFLASGGTPVRGDSSNSSPHPTKAPVGKTLKSPL